MLCFLQNDRMLCSEVYWFIKYTFPSMQWKWTKRSKMGDVSSFPLGLSFLCMNDVFYERISVLIFLKSFFFMVESISFMDVYNS